MSEIERESMEVDVLYVGASPATLASAYHLTQQVEPYNAKAKETGTDTLEPPTILIIGPDGTIDSAIVSGYTDFGKAVEETKRKLLTPAASSG